MDKTYYWCDPGSLQVYTCHQIGEVLHGMAMFHDTDMPPSKCYPLCLESVAENEKEAIRRVFRHLVTARHECEQDIAQTRARIARIDALIEAAT